MNRVVLAWGPAAFWAGVIFYLSSLSHPPGASFFEQLPAGDKLGHLILYGILGATLAHVHRLQGLPAAVLILLGVLYGASDEWHQSFVPGRDVSVFDWMADLVGVSTGFWLFGSVFAPPSPWDPSSAAASVTPPPRPGAS